LAILFSSSASLAIALRKWTPNKREISRFENIVGSDKRLNQEPSGGEYFFAGS
jgi:hypothetical protein